MLLFSISIENVRIEIVALLQLLQNFGHAGGEPSVTATPLHRVRYVVTVQLIEEPVAMLQAEIFDHGLRRESQKRFLPVDPIRQLITVAHHPEWNFPTLEEAPRIALRGSDSPVRIEF